MRRLALALAALALLGPGPAPPSAHAEETPRVLAAHRPQGVPTRADAPAWEAAPATALPLMAQMIAPPVGGGATAHVEVRALHDGRWLGIRLTWADDTADQGVGVDRFRDAVAVGFPEKAGVGVTSPFMGDAQHPVRIWQWAADLQAAAAAGSDAADGRSRGAEGTWYFPYDEGVTERVRAWRGHRPVTALVATGWGSLERLPQTEVEGHGVRDGEGWSVVLRRRLDAATLPGFAPGTRTELIVAIWDGDGAEVNGRKSVTMSWTPFELAPLEDSHAAR